MSRVLITGGTGFLGKALTQRLSSSDFEVMVTGRQPIVTDLPAGVHYYQAPSLGPDANWQNVLTGVDCVVHLAARVHVMIETETDPVMAFHKVNVEGTNKLALDAVQAGVKRLIFLSTVKVNGEHTDAHPFTEDDKANPQDDYGLSKYNAEQALFKIAQDTGLEIVIIRPPLVYGPGVKGNFKSLINLTKRAWPMPLGGLKNARSLVFVGNLCDAIKTCIEHPSAANQTFLVSDSHDISTTELIEYLAHALSCPSRLFKLPATLLYMIAGLFGQKNRIQRLLGSLQINSTKIHKLLGWTPPYNVVQGMQLTVTADLKTEQLIPKKNDAGKP